MSKPEDKFKIHVADKSQFSSVYQHLRENFYLDELILKFITKNKGIEESMIQTVKAPLENGNAICIVAETSDKRIAGVAVCIKWIKNDTTMPTPAFDPTFQKLWDFLNYVDSRVDLYSSYKVDKVLELLMVSVTRQYRGQGLGTALVSKVLEYGKEKGFPIVKGTFTSTQSQNIATKLGLEGLAEIRYIDYKVDGSSDTIFKNGDPSDLVQSSKLMIKKVI